MDSFEARMEETLRGSAAELPDGGFTDRVLRALPRRRAAGARAARWTSLAAAAAGGLIVGTYGSLGQIAPPVVAVLLAGLVAVPALWILCSD
jgi:anti-sigma factor RsiW